MRIFTGGNRVGETATYETLKWPNGARCAVMLSFDLDGDTIWRNGQPRLCWWGGFHPLQFGGQLRPQTLGAALAGAFGPLSAASDFFVPAKVMEDHPALLREIDQAGHEIGPSCTPMSDSWT